MALLFISLIGGILSTLPTPEEPGIGVTTISPPTTRGEVMHIRADGLDTVKIGMPWPEAVSLANLVVQRDTKECSLASDPASGASITAYDQVVTLIMVQDSGVETVAGIGVGDSEDEVFAVYPLDALDTEKGRLVILDGSNELVVGLFGGKVTYLWARQGGIANHC